MPKRRADIASKALRSTKKGKGAAASGAAAPSTSGASVVRPAWLTGRSAEIWGEFAPVLILQGMLTARDALTFGVWCTLGAKIEAGELTGALITQFRLLGNDFGMSPSGKGRELGPIAPPDPGAKKSKFFND